MSTFKESITLTNAADKSFAKRGLIPETEVRAVTLNAWVDTAAWTLAISEKVRAELGLELEGSVQSTLADGTTAEYAMTEGVEICWENRRFILSAQVLPKLDGVLFGALPMEALDLMADPVEECLKGRHGDKPLYILY